MANRYLRNIQYSTEAATSGIFAQVTIGAAGAPTLNFGGSFISGIVRNSAGDYTITLRDTWARLLQFDVTFLVSASAPAAPNFRVKTNNITTGSLTVVFANSAGTATDPANGEVIFMAITVKNSSVVY